MSTRIFDPITAVSYVAPVVTTADAYSDVTSVILDVRGLKDKAFVMKNTGAANALSWKILGSVDDGVEYDIAVKSEADVALSSYEYYRLTDYYSHLKIQIKSKVAGNPTTAIVKFAGLGV